MLTLPRLSRVLIAVVAAGLVASACGGGGSDNKQTVSFACTNGGHPLALPSPIQAIAGSHSSFGLVCGQSALVTGTDIFSFGLVTSAGGLLAGGSPQVWVATGGASRALGPFTAHPYQFTAYQRSGDTSPLTPLTSFYAAEVRIPTPGRWTVAVKVSGSAAGAGTANIAVVPPSQAVHPVGSKAVSTPTPVARSEAQARRICTRKPKPDPLHYISLDKALKNGKPTVVTFATPLLCTSKVCGPVVDEVTAVYDQVGRAKANFIHVEEYPTRNPAKPARAFSAWGFQTEPWVFVIDKGGSIRARYMGPVTAVQIAAALHPLLA